MPTIARHHRGCWCRSARQQDLIGATVRADSLPGLTSPSGPVVRITAQDHTTRPDGTPRCWLIIDGWQRWSIHPTAPGGDTLTVETTDEPTSLDVAIREPIRHDGPMTLGQAGDLVSQITGRYTLAGAQIPVLPGGSAKVRRAFTPRPPAAPQTAQSYYTRGRVRRVPSGLWAADQGWAGTTRSLGEHETQLDAEAAVRDGIQRAWTRLEEWLDQYVHGSWTLELLPIEEIEVQDRVTAAQAAEIVGVSDSTWRGYVARGQAPAPDGRDERDRPWWHRGTVETWTAGRRGQGWRRGQND
jgi:hypothetical protein